MSFGTILDRILAEGFGERKVARERLDRSGRSLQGQPGIDRIVEELRRTFAGDGQQGLGGRARDFLKGEQAKGMTGGQIGGIGAAAGLLFGGGLGGAVRGGALAVLGTLAYSAYRRAQGDGASVEAAGALAGPDTERLLVKAMIAAANADGQVTAAELDRILGTLHGEDASPEEKQFVQDQLARPMGAAAVAAEVKGPAQAAEVYAASLMVVDGESAAERAYLRALASALKLDAETVSYLHEQTGAPSA